MSNTFDLKKLNPVEQVQPLRRFCFLGKTMSGKTTVMLDMIKKIQVKFDLAILLSPTSDTREEFCRHFPDLVCVDPNNIKFDDWLMNLLQFLDETKKKHKRHVLLVLDDCASVVEIMKSKRLPYLFQNGRHSGITLVFSAQYIINVPTTCRSQIDMISTMVERNEKNAENLRQVFFADLCSKQEFPTVLNFFTSDRKALISFPMVSDADKTKRYFWYKAEKPIDQQPHFVVGTRRMWKLAYMMTKPKIENQHQHVDLPFDFGGDEKEQKSMKDEGVLATTKVDKKPKSKITFDEMRLIDDIPKTQQASSGSVMNNLANLISSAVAKSKSNNQTSNQFKEEQADEIDMESDLAVDEEEEEGSDIEEEMEQLIEEEHNSILPNIHEPLLKTTTQPLIVTKQQKQEQQQDNLTDFTQLNM